jgi:hypothetical protein
MLADNLLATLYLRTTQHIITAVFTSVLASYPALVGYLYIKLASILTIGCLTTQRLLT